MGAPWLAAGPWAASVATAWITQCPACPEARVTCGSCPACKGSPAFSCGTCPGCPHRPTCSLACGAGPGWWAVGAALAACLLLGFGGAGLLRAAGWVAARAAGLVTARAEGSSTVALVVQDSEATDSGGQMAQRTLDVPEPQVCVNFDDSDIFRWHHRLLLVQLSPGVLVAASPDGEVLVLDLSGHLVYAFGELSDEDIEALRVEARGLAVVMGVSAPTAPPRATVSSRIQEADEEDWRAEKRRGPGRDPRISPISRRGPGYHVVLSDALGRMNSLEISDWPLRGPKALPELLTAVVATGLTLTSYWGFWVSESGVLRNAGVLQEMRRLLNVLHHVVTYDLLDTSNLASFKLAGRRVLHIQRAAKRCPRRQSFKERLRREEQEPEAKKDDRPTTAQESVIKRVRHRVRGFGERPKDMDSAGALQEFLKCKDAQRVAKVLSDFDSDAARPVAAVPEEEDIVEPCWDPLLNLRVLQNRGRLVDFRRRLAARGLSGGRRRRQARASAFFVAKKNGGICVAVDARQPNQLHKLPPRAALASGEALGSINLLDAIDASPEGLADFDGCYESLCAGSFDLMGGFYQFADPSWESWMCFDVQVTADELGIDAIYDAKLQRRVPPDEPIWSCFAALPIGWSFALWICLEVLVNAMDVAGLPRDARCLDEARAPAQSVDRSPRVDDGDFISFIASAINDLLAGLTDELDGRGLDWQELERAQPGLVILGMVLHGVLGACYAFAGGDGEPAPVARLPPDVPGELATTAGLIFLGEVDLCRVPSDVALTTDSSLRGYAACEARLEPWEVLATTQWRERQRFVAAEAEVASDDELYEGRAVDFTDPSEPLPLRAPPKLRRAVAKRRRVELEIGVPPEPLADALPDPGRWTERRRGSWRRPGRIHAREARAAVAPLWRAAADVASHGKEILSLCDNISSVIAFEKGRATNFELLAQCRRAAAVRLGREIRWRPRHAPGIYNVADHGGRAANRGELRAGFFNQPWVLDSAPPDVLGSLALCVEGPQKVLYHAGLSGIIVAPLRAAGVSQPSGSRAPRKAFLELFAGAANLAGAPT
ncbi:unnamed protein product, partial [Prorocentrum cordatum]